MRQNEPSNFKENYQNDKRVNLNVKVKFFSKNVSLDITMCDVTFFVLERIRKYLERVKKI